MYNTFLNKIQITHLGHFAIFERIIFRGKKGFHFESRLLFVTAQEIEE